MSAAKPSGKNQSAKGAKGGAGPKCPICRKPASQAYRPFCGKACADVDLSRWLDGRYVVPGEPVGSREDTDDGD